jgi:hypothetical protein
MTNAEQKARSILEKRLEGRATVAFVEEKGDSIAIEITTRFSSYAVTGKPNSWPTIPRPF